MEIRVESKIRCTVCLHKDRVKIDEAMTAGEPLSSISKKSGISVSSLARHRKNHMDLRIIRTKTKNIPPTLSTGNPRIDNIANQVANLFGSAIELMEKAKKEKQYNAAVNANKQALNCLEVYFKSSETVYKIKKAQQAEEDAHKVTSKILEALKDHPEARIAVARTLDNRSKDE